MSLDFHPFSMVFPLLPDAELAELAADIKAFGLREPIWLYEGKILDGRNRWLACQRVNVDPACQTFKGEPKGALALVVSRNVQRRHLTPSQLAMAAAAIANLRVGANQHSEGVSLETGSAMVGASVGSAKRARAVLDKGSKPLQDAVKSGAVPLTRAAAATAKPKREQLAAAKAKPQKPAEPTAQQNEPSADLSEFLTPDEVERQEADEKRYLESLERAAGDSLAEVKRLNGLLSEAYRARDRYMNECSAMRKQLQAKDREIARLKKAA